MTIVHEPVDESVHELVREPVHEPIDPTRLLARREADRIRHDPARIGGAVELTRQLGLILVAILLYFGVRGLTEGDVGLAVRHGRDVYELERRIGLDLEHWAQALIIDHHWLVTLANWVYIWGHWPVIAVTLLWLHRSHRRTYLVLRNAMFISGAIGLVIFAAYAVAPPRLAGIGLIDTVTDNSNAYRVLQPPSLVNKYAAVPSLHVGWNFLVGVALYRVGGRRWTRLLALVGPILMAIAVVLTANHYVIDGFIGIAVAYVGLQAATWVTPRLEAVDQTLRYGWRTIRSDGSRSLPGVD